ncbi:glycosyltransferase family 2 protein [Pedobacter sp. SYP-B3415]|uniref:glycosyltransferase family 2 protein n=1 Tax=Pedobacter sp. SYP-B3415 TaxID=2496641 RepID=UPI00101C75D8|nr:glycosyltransferase [Pedobacter sp. SYP-B3415]
MLSVVVLAYDRCAEVLITISKLKAFAVTLPFPVEIIVVDNASVDDTTLRIQEQHPDITLVTKIKNNGIAGWNDGFALARHKYMLVLDDDSHPEHGVAEAVAYMEVHPRTGILALNITSGPYRTDDWVWQNAKPWQHEELILGFFGCGAIIRKDVYDKIGGFAEWMTVYAHEWEYGLRCMNAGYEIRYFQTSSVNHRASMVNRSKKRMMIYGSKNEMLMVYQFIANRWKFLLRMFINNMKRMYPEGPRAGYYYLLGGIKFLKERHTIPHTPVNSDVQQFFTSNYMNTFPVFRFLTRRIKALANKN